MKLENLLNKILPYLIVLFAFLAIMGWDYSLALGDQFRGGRIRYLLMGLAVCQFLYMQGINPWWAAFSAWSFFLWCFFDFSGFGAADVALIPGCLLMGDMIRRLLKGSTVLFAIGHMAIAQGLLGLLQAIGFDPLFIVEPGWRHVAIGTFGHNTLLAPFLAMGALYFLTRPKTDSFALISFLFLTFMVFVTGSSMGIGAFGIGLLYCIWRYRPNLGPYLFVGSVAGLIGAYALFSRTELFNFNGRLFVWPRALQGVIQSPIIGHGPGSFLEKQAMWGLDGKAAGMNWDQAHQEYLQTWIETGIIGLAIVLAGLYFTMRICKNLHPIYGAMVVILAVNSLANFPMHIAAYGLIAGWLAAVTWHKRSEE